MPSECWLSRRRSSLLRQAQDGELAEPQPRWDWRRLRTCTTRKGYFGSTNQDTLRQAQGRDDALPIGFATVSNMWTNNCVRAAIVVNFGR